MEVNCEGCAGCCVDWRPVGPPDLDHDRSAPRPPLDDTYNLVPLLRDEVREFVSAGLGDALVPRLFEAAPDDESVTIDGHDLAAIDGRPVFHVGIRTAPKPVAPFGVEPRWLRTCAFLDPETLQCRIHDTEQYPRTCSVYPGHNLLLDRETECERVEAAHGVDRLLEDTPPDGPDPLLGPQAVGATLFVHPDPDRLSVAVGRLAAGESTPADRADFVGVAAGSSPGSTEVNAERAAEARERVLAADSWVGRAIDDWDERAGEVGEQAPGTDGSAREVEADRGAPETPGW